MLSGSGVDVNTAKQRQVLHYLRHTLERLAAEGVDWLPFRRQEVSVATSSVVGEPADDDTMARITQQLDGCTRCRLSQHRTHIVLGRGSHEAALMFVGEAPGYDEDRIGLPFVGRAGQLLDKIIAAMGFDRDEVYIANVIKCRPPQNRNPRDDEIGSCYPFLKRQIHVVAPKLICTLGTFAAQTLLGSIEPISRLRGRFHQYEGIPLLPTYHPAYLLRNPEMKKVVWQDVQQISVKLGRTPVGKK